MIRVWYYAVAGRRRAVLAGSVVPLGLEGVASAARKVAAAGAGSPPGPPRPRTTHPRSSSASSTIPTVPRESERPSWLVIPRDGAVIPACSSSARSAPARPPPACTRSPSSSSRGKPTGPHAGPAPLVLEVKGDFCYKYGSMIANIVPCGPIVFRKAFITM